MASLVRLFLDHPLRAGEPVPLSQPQAHYLFAVMRLGPGAELRIFDGRSGEWRAEVAEAGKRGGLLLPVEQVRPQTAPPDLWLLFAPVKKARTDFIVEKAVELGAARLLPVLTDFTNAERVRQDRLDAQVIEAAEQSGRVEVPEVAEPAKLSRLLDGWDPARPLWLCDETLLGEPSRPPASPGPGAVLVGPEGGFSPAERARMAALPFVSRVSLGPRILRADTAVVAALTLWQSLNGDWR